jgi:hypothetical protein
MFAFYAGLISTTNAEVRPSGSPKINLLVKNTLAYFVKPSASNANDFSFLLTARQNKLECLHIKHCSLFCPAVSN